MGNGEARGGERLGFGAGEGKMEEIRRQDGFAHRNRPSLSLVQTPRQMRESSPHIKHTMVS
jgi:hypothetical protein